MNFVEAKAWRHPKDIRGEAEPLEITPAYPLEVKRHELWGNIVREFAPSLTDVNPSRILPVTTLPRVRTIDREEANEQITESLSVSDTFSFVPQADSKNASAVYSLIALLPDRGYSGRTGVHADFLKQALTPVARQSTTLGIHGITPGDADTGTIFLPINTEYAKNWEMFYNLNSILGPEGQRLLIRYCSGLTALACDLESHSDNPTVVDLQNRVRGDSYLGLLIARYSGARQISARRAAAITIAQEAASKNIPQDVVARAAEQIGNIGMRRIPSFFEFSTGQGNNVIATSINDVAIDLKCSYSVAREIAHRAIGLSLSVEELYAKHPGNIQKAQSELTAIVFIDKIHLHALREAKSPVSQVTSIVSPNTLRLFRKDLELINQASIQSGKISGMSDGVISHELSHGVLSALASQNKSANPDGWSHYREGDEEEHVVEAIRIALGFRDSVQQCSYYNASPDARKDIDEKARQFSSMTPVERERMLKKFVADSRYPKVL